MTAGGAATALDPRTCDVAVVAIGASAGGIAALRAVLSRLRPDFPAAVVVVQHLHPHFRTARIGARPHVTPAGA